MFLLIASIPFVCFVAAILVTVVPATVLVTRTYRAQVPLDMGEVGLRGDAYRAPSFTMRLAKEQVAHPTDSLPQETLLAAGLLRTALCLASLFAVPVLFGGLVELGELRHGVRPPGAFVVLGLSGLALAVAQLLARRRLLLTSPRSPGTALFVGVWTIIHNLFVLACVAATPEHGDSWRVVNPAAGGIVFIGYACLSITLGVVLLRAASPQRRWLRMNGVIT